MVEKTKKIVHKKPNPSQVSDTECGVFFTWGVRFEIRQSWRGVTCKRCLRSKPKKGPTK